MAELIKLSGIGNLSLRDVIDIEKLQKIQDEFAAETGLGMITVDSMGRSITDASGFSALCQLLRRDPWVRKRCMSCDAHGGLQGALDGRPVVYKCHAGLVDFAVPIVSDERFIGAVLAGQVLMRNERMPKEILPNKGQFAIPDEAEDLIRDVNTVNLETIHRSADAIIKMVNEKIGNNGKKLTILAPSPIYGRLNSVPDVERKDRFAPLLAGRLTHKALPLRPITQKNDALDSILDPYLITGNVLRRDLGANMQVLEQFLDATLPSWIMKLKTTDIARFEDVLIGIASSDSVSTGRDISQMVIQHRMRTKREMNRYDSFRYCENLLIALHNLMEPTLKVQERTVNTLLNEIEKDPTAFLTVEDGAEYLNGSHSHFSRTFRNHTGSTFIQYVTAKRLEKAKMILAHTDKPISRIASALKFHPENYLSRGFKKHVGVTPGEYRQQYSEENNA